MTFGNKVRGILFGNTFVPIQEEYIILLGMVSYAKNVILPGLTTQTVAWVGSGPSAGDRGRAQARCWPELDQISRRTNARGPAKAHSFKQTGMCAQPMWES